MKFHWFLFLITCICTQPVMSEDVNKVEMNMTHSLQQLMDTLNPDVKERILFDMRSEERFNWHFFPKERKGVSLNDLDKEQEKQSKAFLGVGLSDMGLKKALGVITLESVLYNKGNQNPNRDPGKYFFSVFGQPNAEKSWGWRFEGHHLSLNFTLDEGKLISVTPLFMGANPAEVEIGPHKGLKLLSAEENRGRKLVTSLSEEQREKAIIAERAPSDIITGAKRSVDPLKPNGLPLSEMTDEQREQCLKLVKEYIFRVNAQYAVAEMDKIRAAGFDQIYFAWAGGFEPRHGHYYRIQGPHFVLEYDNTQGGANHIHTVWRDFKNDFGVDVLRQHYSLSPHHQNYN